MDGLLVLLVGSLMGWLVGGLVGLMNVWTAPGCDGPSVQRRAGG